ncbi:ABC transporter ATP-binding protein [Pasteurella canis]|uniref:ABC transporter ATP-binding protein n=1 Tax=Pasteurella canis TaxID=753 RepID=UPI001CC052F1|nr:ABC transporter ATP-binding protein [Pasteurella canis]
MTEMVINLDCGAEVQILKVNNGKYQLFEVTNQSIKALGEAHSEINHVFGELIYFALNEYETLSLKEMQDVVTNTMNKIEEWFKLHSEYLVNLEKGSM